MHRLTYEAVMASTRVSDLISPLRLAFTQAEAAPPRGHYPIQTAGGQGTLLVMPATGAAGFGAKISSVVPGNPSRGLAAIQGEFLLFSAETAAPVALIDGRALTLLRTAAVSALAADLLAPPSPQTLLVVGAGALAGHLARGHAVVRPYQSILVWARDPAKSRALALDLTSNGLECRAETDLETAVRAADVISCATMAETPLVLGRWLRPDVHLDLVGSFTPQMRETDSDCFVGASVVVDTLAASTESGDLTSAIEGGVLAATAVVALGEALRDPTPRARRTVFKSVGVALADLASAAWIDRLHREPGAPG
jgi:ornithine cyclodeaminase/alanine dehydrogenase-like protein (mu-crystallin family)